jgi:hypothetical protein
MKITNDKPPIWASIKTLFDFNERTTIFTYGDTIYNPAGVRITPDLIAHESIHEVQQSAMNIFGLWGAARWWKKYLHNPQFRFDQELEAYRAQYKFVKARIQESNKLSTYLINLAYALSGSMYGNVCGFGEAMRRIKEPDPPPYNPSAFHGGGG